MVFLLRLSLLLLIFMPRPALANAPLIFVKSSSDLRVQSIVAFLQETGSLSPGAAYETAPVDLNYDGVEETIVRVRNEACEASADCLFLITGISRKKPILLTTLHARKIGIATEKAYGVKKILVYDQKQNDFQYITYGWDPYSTTFKAE